MLKQIPLSNITKINIQKKREIGDYCFSLTTTMEEGRVFYISTDSITNFCEWLIAIDGLIIGSQKTARWNTSILDWTQKSLLIRKINFSKKKGGLILRNHPSDNDELEKWSYFPNGSVQKIGNKGKILISYSWDGITFCTNENKKNFGTGKWNGIRLSWYREFNHEISSENTPDLNYIYNPELQMYQHAVPSNSVKWFWETE